MDTNERIAVEVMGWSQIGQDEWMFHDGSQIQIVGDPRASANSFDPLHSHDDFMLALEKLTEEQQVSFIHKVEHAGHHDHWAVLTAPLSLKCAALLKAVE